jgi:hypothetical protein
VTDAASYDMARLCTCARTTSESGGSCSSLSEKSTRKASRRSSSLVHGVAWQGRAGHVGTLRHVREKHDTIRTYVCMHCM